MEEEQERDGEKEKAKGRTIEEAEEREGEEGTNSDKEGLLDAGREFGDEDWPPSASLFLSKTSNTPKRDPKESFKGATKQEQLRESLTRGLSGSPSSEGAEEEEGLPKEREEEEEEEAAAK